MTLLVLNVTFPLAVQEACRHFVNLRTYRAAFGQAILIR